MCFKVKNKTNSSLKTELIIKKKENLKKVEQSKYKRT